MDDQMPKCGITITRIWCDDDMDELKVAVSDGASLFSAKVYVGHGSLPETVARLNAFKDHVHGGILDIRWGEFGPEYANGAFDCRLHFAKGSRLYITCRMESEYTEFSVNKVASSATLYLMTEPALLDRFISQLEALAGKFTDQASLEAI